jgi:acyl carrier protein
MKNAETIRRYIEDELIKDEVELALDEPIFSAGLLDSFAVIQLMRFLEDKFGVVIPVHQVTLSDFDSISKIAHLIQRYAPME